MSHEKIKSITVKNNEVWLNSKCNNDTEPFKVWHCTSLTTILVNEGREACDIAILKDYEEGIFQSADSVNNKYTNALKVLRSMEEYKNYNWRLSNYEDNCPIRKNRNSPGYVELLKVALNTNPTEIKGKFIIVKFSGGRNWYLRRITTKRVLFSLDKKDAKVFIDKEEAERLKGICTGGEEWIFEDTEAIIKQEVPNIKIPINTNLQLSFF